jgi:hypothetical protein
MCPRSAVRAWCRAVAVDRVRWLSVERLEPLVMRGRYWGKAWLHSIDMRPLGTMLRALDHGVKVSHCLQMALEFGHGHDH